MADAAVDPRMALTRRAKAYGVAAGTAVALKLLAAASREVFRDWTDETSVAVFMVLSILGTVLLWLWLGITAFRCAKALGWHPWQCWLCGVGCGIVQWAAWIMYFVFRSQIQARIRDLDSAGRGAVG